MSDAPEHRGPPRYGDVMTMRRTLRMLAICALAIAVAGCQGVADPGNGNGNGNDNGNDNGIGPGNGNDNGNGNGNGNDNGNGGGPNDAMPTGLVALVDGFVQPVDVTAAGDGSGRLFVAEQGGTVWTVVDGVRQADAFLDLTGLTAADGERGLLAVAFHPDFATNGRLFVHLTDETANGPGDSLIAEVSVSPPDATAADADSLREILTITGPNAFHHGGQLAFGPDGYLYVAVGDRGAPAASQDLDTLTGSILRIDVDGAHPYEAPADNPFVGTPSAHDEIWAYGFRNPWRLSFDSLTGDLWIADVGEDDAEEINLQPADSPGGENYGWPTMEGDACHDPPTGCNMEGLTPPTLSYPTTSEGGRSSVTGGHVYRGSTFGGLVGAYVFGDFMSGRVYLAEEDEGDWTMDTLFETNAMIVAIGRDEASELIFVDYAGGVVYEFAE